jgi:uncharacterized membrane protein YqjE
MSRGADDPGLLDALTRLGGNLVGALRNRLELASIELGEASARLVATVVAGMAAVLLLGGAVGMLTAWVAAALWSTLGAAVLAWLALAYALAGAGLLWWLQHRLRSAPLLLADTLAELQRDASALHGGRDR